MKKELIDNLHSRFPLLFQKKVIPTVGDGWFDIINDLCKIIEHHVSTLPEEIQAQVYAEQIKEKFGELRFYLVHDTPYIQGAIDMAEYCSRHTCELCGNTGKVVNFFGWLRCLCEVDLEKETKIREQRGNFHEKKA